MANPSSPSAPAKRSPWPRRLLFAFGGLLVLLLAVYFCVTSSAFFKGVILPRAGKAMGATITVEDASISPFSHIELTQLKVMGAGSDPVLQVKDVNLRYSLFSILKGAPNVEEITIDSPVVQIIQNPDGTSNVDPLLKQQKPASTPQPASSTESKPLHIDVKNFAVKNASMRRVERLPGGATKTTEVSGINLALDRLANGQSGKFTAAANCKISGPTNDALEATFTADVGFSLNESLAPTSLKAKVMEQVAKADGAYQSLAGIRSELTADMTPTEVREMAERVYRGDQLLSSVSVAGPLDLTKNEGHLTLRAGPIDRQVLNLIGGPMGIDFGASTLNSVTEMTLSKNGTFVEFKTQFTGTNLAATQNGETSPPLDFAVASDVAVDLKNKTAQIQALTVDGQINQQPFLKGALTQPMTVAYGDTAAAPGDSAFALTIMDLNLAQWRPLLGGGISAGTFGLDLKVSSQAGGKQLAASVASRIDGLDAMLGSNHITQGLLEVKLDAQTEAFKKFVLTNCAITLTERSQPALNVTASASYDGASMNLRSDVEAVMARLTGQGSEKPLSASVKVDASVDKQVLNLNQVNVAFAPTQRAPKNELNISGQWDSSSPGLAKGRLDIKADTLDLTPVYDAISSPAGSSKSTAEPSAQTASASGGNEEPDAKQLPLQFTANVDIKQAWLREISAQNCLVTAKVENNKVQVNPLSVSLNGAPVKGNVDLDLGVKGYTYAVEFSADKVPVEPLANSFSPEDAGKYKGDLLAAVKIKGAGVTGVSLKKSLDGQVGFTMTNADIQLTGPKMKKIVGPIASVLGLSEILATPLKWVDAQTALGGGNITINRCIVESSAFEGSAQGVIPIADILTNSLLNLPVQIALPRALAQKVGLASSDASANAAYVPLKNFVTVKGAIGEPKSDIDKAALGGVFLKSGAALAEKLGGKNGGQAGGISSGLGNILGQSKKAQGTNGTATNAPAKSNPLNNFLK